MIPARRRTLKGGDQGSGPVLYWMSRDQRAGNNWALIYTQHLALERKVPLVVSFCLAPGFLGTTIRHYGFMLRGFREVEKSLGGKRIPFFLLTGKSEVELLSLVGRLGAGALVTDFDPLRTKKGWKKAVSQKINIPFIEVDAHNIVPCWEASNKQEWTARTFRPKINRLLPDYLPVRSRGGLDHPG